jgi:uncharacterized membrane protein YkvA (DUF1232 family)
MRTALRNLNHWLDAQAEKLRNDMTFALRQVHVLTLVLRHPEAPRRAKAAAAFAALYVLSPIQLIPTFIPVIGQMDDLFVVWLAMKFVRKRISKRVIADCELQAKLSPATRANESAAPYGQESPLSFVQSD